MFHLRFSADPLQGAIARVFGLREAQAEPCTRPESDITRSEMSRLVRDLQLVDARGRKYLAADERRRFLEPAARAPRPHRRPGFRSPGHLPRGRRPRGWREVPVPPELLRALELVHALRSAPVKAAGRPLLALVAATLGHAQPADHRGLHHSFGPRGAGVSGQDVGRGEEF